MTQTRFHAGRATTVFGFISLVAVSIASLLILSDPSPLNIFSGLLFAFLAVFLFSGLMRRDRPLFVVSDEMVTWRSLYGFASPKSTSLREIAHAMRRNSRTLALTMRTGESIKLPVKELSRPDRQALLEAIEARMASPDRPSV